MPRNFMFTKQQITDAALDITRKSGISAVTARALGNKLGTSSKPIFGLFDSMEDVHRSVLEAADKIYHSYLDEDMSSGKYPPYKASGMAYIRFAKEEKQLFKLLFMRDRTHESITENKEDIRPLLDLIMKNLGISEDAAYRFHLEMWIYVHGIATMIATSYLDFDEEFISDMLSGAYNSFKCSGGSYGSN